jgi:hypothetical protein
MMNDLYAIAKANGLKLPLRSSLFWWFIDHAESTWGYLARNLPAATLQAMLDWQIKHGMDTMIFLTYSRLGECLVNPFTTYDLQSDIPVDMAEVIRWGNMLNPGAYGANLIPCLFCDDDAGIAAAVEFQNYYVPAICVGLRPYAKLVCAGLEMTEQFDPTVKKMLASVKAERKAAFRRKISEVAALCHHYTDLPVVAHIQWDCESKLPAGLNGIIFEHPWHPGEGSNHSVDETVSIADRAIRAAKEQGIAVGFDEYNLNVNDQRYWEQREALSKLMCFMI